MRDQPNTGIYREVDLPGDFALVTPGLFVMDDTPILSLEYHDVLELGHCHKGNGIFVVGNKILPFSAGDVSIIAPGELHLAQSSRGTTSAWTFLFLDIEMLISAHFPELSAFNIHTYAGVSFNNMVSHHEHPLLVELVRSLVREAQERKLCYRTMILSQLAALATVLDRDFEGISTRTANIAAHSAISQIRKALEYIAQHYYEPIKVEYLARLCNMSVRNFDRRFSQAMKRSAHNYITDTRIAMACIHLLRSDAPISRIAELCGYVSISAFNRSFRVKRGMSPRGWRRAREAREE